MALDVEQLVVACQRKEGKAQKALYDQYAPSLLGVCMRYTHSRDEAQDLLQEGFIKIFEKIGTVQNSKSLFSWMYSIMVHESINYVTRRMNVCYCDIQEVEDVLPDSVAEPFDTDEFEVALVVRALQEIPDLYRMAFNMRIVEEREYADISAALGFPESTIRCAVTRAKQLIKDKMKRKEQI